MTAYNVVRFRVKPGREKEFIDLQTGVSGRDEMKGFRKLALIKTGERTYCIVGEWGAMDDIVKARPQMIASLDKMRGLLEDLGGGLGVTDPVSGRSGTRTTSSRRLTAVLLVRTAENRQPVPSISLTACAGLRRARKGMAPRGADRLSAPDRIRAPAVSWRARPTADKRRPTSPASPSRPKVPVPWPRSKSTTPSSSSTATR